MTDEDENLLRIFDQQLLRKIHGSIRNVDDTSTIRTNHELHQIIVGADVVRYIKSLRIVWTGHVARMNQPEEESQGKTRMEGDC